MKLILRLAILCLVIIHSFGGANAQDKCGVKHFIKFFHDPNHYAQAGQMVADGNNMIITGDIVLSDPADMGDAFVAKLDANGKMLWQITVGGPGVQFIEKITKLASGDFMACGHGYTSAGYNFFLVRLTTSGTIVWRKDYGTDDGTHGVNTPGVIKEDADGSIIVAGTNYVDTSFGGVTLSFMKFTAAGKPVYSKFYTPPANTSGGLMFPNDVVIKDGYSYVAGYLAEGAYIEGLFMKFNNATGNIVWSNLNTFNGTEIEFSNIFSYKNNQLCLMGSHNINADDTCLVLVADTSGTIVSSRYIRYPTSRSGEHDLLGKAAMTSNYEIIWAPFFNTDAQPLHFEGMLIKILPEKGIVWAKAYDKIDSLPRTRDVCIAADSSIFIYGGEQNLQSASNLMYLGKFSPSGDNGCTPGVLPGSGGNGITSIEKLSFALTGKKVIGLTVSNLSGPAYILPGDSTCQEVNVCDSLKLTGPTKLCGYGDTFAVHIGKKPGCTATPSLLYDSSLFSLLSYQNNIASFTSTRGGQGYIKASMENTCTILQDSVLVTVPPYPNTLNLGNDTAVCTGDSIMLNAKSGFVKYMWQDGTGDTSFTVRKGGVYYVTVTNACGKTLSDTVTVTQASAPNFTLAGPLNKCNTDSVLIQGPAGFKSYTWSPKYNIVDTSAQTAIVYPGIDTDYFLHVEDANGCKADNSVRLLVKSSPVIDLGRDTGLCYGASVILRAGTGFSQYTWSDGSTADTLKVNATGTYSVAAVYSNGCRPVDTISINFSPPVAVKITGSQGICAGSSIILNAGNGYAVYAWNNGSSGPLVNITDTGVYWVDVKDLNKCAGSDTFNVTSFLKPPAGFLPADTSLCTYRTLTLAPGQNYSSYLWSTNELTKTITVATPGIYWLQVTGDNTCTGRDSVTVAGKQCAEGFFIPGAFTPNGDGNNDVFRPLLYGNIASYHFVMYNRWGIKIFESAIPGAGWDGTVRGSKQPTGSYVWYCTYILQGAAAKVEKGTVVLMR